MHKSEYDVQNYIEKLKSNTKHDENNLEQFDCGFSTLHMLGSTRNINDVEHFDFMTKKDAFGKNIKHNENDIDAGYSTIHFSVKAPKIEKCNENNINQMIGQIKKGIKIDQKNDLDYGYTTPMQQKK
jgi:hypothetical protein